ncbi:MAG TPA: hypothetical protein DEP53_05910 [Bacteroidetes bacterium]|nr:hypothetical protein [Bacteroidota bacterium]
MELKKTTILPTDDAALANRLFKHLIDEVPTVLFIVFGIGEEAEILVQRADKLAGAENEPRRVVWARRPELVASVLSTLKGETEMVAKIVSLQVRAFTLSLSDVVKDLLTLDEPLPSLTRVLKAYVRAEKEGA